MRPEVFATRSAKMILSSGSAHQTLHRHRPVELILALDGPIELRSRDRKVDRSESFLIPPMRTHALSQYQGRVARIYLDTGYRRLTWWKNKPLAFDLAETPALCARLRRFYESDRDPGDAALTIAAWLRSAVGTLGDAPPCDSRIANVLAFLDSHVRDVRSDRHTLAARVSLSPSRFAALFAAETGMPLSQYLIWRRVKLALTSICAGAGMTDAAVAAGFADGAHLSRCCRATYGCKPSSAAGRHVVLVGDAIEQDVVPHICLAPHLTTTAAVSPL